MPPTHDRLTTQSPITIANDPIEIRTTLRFRLGVSGLSPFCPHSLRTRRSQLLLPRLMRSFALTHFSRDHFFGRIRSGRIDGTNEGDDLTELVRGMHGAAHQRDMRVPQ